MKALQSSAREESTPISLSANFQPRWTRRRERGPKLSGEDRIQSKCPDKSLKTKGERKGLKTAQHPWQLTENKRAKWNLPISYSKQRVARR